MAERTLTIRTYVIVGVLLILFTFLTVGTWYFQLAGRWHLLVGLSIALCKAALIVLFFMHALVSPRLTWIVILVACCWLSILVVLTLSDYCTRGMVPFMPGH